MHDQGVSWSDLLAALKDAEIDYAEQRFAGYEHPSVLASIKVSMDALESEDPRFAARFCELAAFLARAASPRPRSGCCGPTRGISNHGDVSKLLAKLAGRALLRREGDEDARRVLIHDLQRDYLLRVTDADALNAAVLTAYRATLDQRVTGSACQRRPLHLGSPDRAPDRRRRDPSGPGGGLRPGLPCPAHRGDQRLRGRGRPGRGSPRALPEDELIGQLGSALRQWAIGARGRARLGRPRLHPLRSARDPGGRRRRARAARRRPLAAASLGAVGAAGGPAARARRPRGPGDRGGLQPRRGPPGLGARTTDRAALGRPERAPSWRAWRATRAG